MSRSLVALCSMASLVLLPLAADAAPDDLRQARALIDRMTAELEKMIEEVERATSEAEVQEIGDRFKATADGMKVEGERLSGLLTDDERAEVERYGRERMTPLMARLMQAMMKHMPPPAEPEPDQPAPQSKPAAQPEPEPPAGVACGSPAWRPFRKAVTAYCTGNAKARKGCASLVEVVHECRDEFTGNELAPLPDAGIAAGTFTYSVSAVNGYVFEVQFVKKAKLWTVAKLKTRVYE